MQIIEKNTILKRICSASIRHYYNRTTISHIIKCTYTQEDVNILYKVDIYH